MNSQVESATDTGKDRVVAVADELFKKYGIKSVSVDDIAKELSISKRTLYQHFQTKDDLVMAVVEMVMNNHCCEVKSFKCKAENAVHHLFLVTHYFKLEVSSINPVLFYDLKKFYPNAWTVYRFHKDHVILRDIVNVMQQGIEQGLFWSDMDCEILGRMRVYQIEMAFDGDIFPHDKHGSFEVQVQLFQHFVRGICTPKGLELYQQYQNKPI
jgi:hypothetical protein